MLEIIELSASRQGLTSKKICVASGLVNEIECRFTLDGIEWDELGEIYAMFENDARGTKKQMALVNGACNVPHEVLLDKGNVCVNLVGKLISGETLEKRLPSYKTKIIEVNQKVNLDAENSVPPTPDVWEQDVARIDARIDTEEAERANADTLLQNNIDAEANARQQADSALQGDIVAEANARVSADNTLQANIEAEAQTRANEIARVEGEIPSLDGYATEVWVEEQGYAKDSELSEVAKTGNYNDLENKPTIPTKTSDLDNDSGFITADYHDDTKADKSTTYTKTEVDTELDTKQDVITDLATIRSGASLGATALQPPAITDMATKTWVGLQGFITKMVDDLVNYYTKSETYTQAEVDSLISAVSQFRYLVAQTLPTASADTMGIIYLVPSADPKTQNIKDEFITINDGGYKWEQIGSTAIDLTGYATEQWVEAKGYITESALSGYATESWVSGQIAGFLNENEIRTLITSYGFITSSALTPYRTSANQDTIDNGIKNRLDTIEGKEAGWDAKIPKVANATAGAVPTLKADGTLEDSEMLLSDLSLFSAGLNEGNYKAVMRKWFIANGSLALTDFSQLCDRWYSITRTGWTGGTKFAHNSISTLSTGTAIGDNVGMVCNPSTLSTKGRDDYASVPLFFTVDCNVVLDDNGKPHITAIDGICGEFERYNPSKIVCAMQMTPFIKYSEDADYIYVEYTDEWKKDGYSVWSDAVDLDGTARTWVVHVKYAFGDDYSACAGRPVHTWDISHNAQLAGIRSKWGNRYCGKTAADDAWIKWQMYIKYKALSPEVVGMLGCTSYYNNTVHPALGESNVKRVLLTSGQLNTFVVGSTVCVGTASYGAKAALCSVVDRATIESIETVSIEGTNYTALNLDVEESFTANTDLFVTSWMWTSGSLDDVPGFDGARVLDSRKYPFKIQGIECVIGCYEVFGDSILRYDEISGAFYCRPYVCRDASKLATSITTDYKGTSYHAPVSPESSAWQYIQRLGHDSSLPEVMFPELAGSPASSSNLYRDALYNEHVTSVRLREWLAVGTLNFGGNAGVSCADAPYSLSTTIWSLGGRLSVTGNRGELQSVA